MQALPCTGAVQIKATPGISVMWTSELGVSCLDQALPFGTQVEAHMKEGLWKAGQVEQALDLEDLPAGYLLDKYNSLKQGKQVWDRHTPTCTQQKSHEVILHLTM